MGARLSVNMCSAPLASLFDVRVCEVCKGEVCDASGWDGEAGVVGWGRPRALRLATSGGGRAEEGGGRFGGGRCLWEERGVCGGGEVVVPLEASACQDKGGEGVIELRLTAQTWMVGFMCELSMGRCPVPSPPISLTLFIGGALRVGEPVQVAGSGHRAAELRHLAAGARRVVA